MLYYDLETRSRCDLRAAGAYRYAEDASTEIMLIAWALDDGPVNVVDMTMQPLPEQLRRALEHDTCVVHNAGFERPMVSNKLGVDVAPERYHDTAAQARTLALPHSLDALGAVVGLDANAAKNTDGKRLIRTFSTPQQDGAFIEPTDRPGDWARFIEYARQDVAAMREIHHRLPTWVYRGAEKQLADLDQRINDRGYGVDVVLAQRALELIEREQHRLAERINVLTDGKIQSATRRDALLRYLHNVYGLALPDMQEHTLLTALDDETMPAEARELIKIRLQASKTSTAKYHAVVQGACHDNRLRGTLFYYGAHTGRWSGKTPMQPQNLPRPSMAQGDIEEAVNAIRSGHADLLYSDVMQVASDCLRSVITAPAGQRLAVSDLSNIEGRALAWQAGETWKLDAFRAFDEGRGPDLYKTTAATIMGCRPEEVDKAHRTALGKVPELACIAEGSTVLTDWGVVGIEQVTTDMRVWDGAEWVSHNGVIFRGIKEVMTYDGLTATPDHLVWVDGQHRPIQLRDAAASGQRLQRQASSNGKAKELARDQGSTRRTRVYDIADAGPRHRFTVSGCLVHNCGFAGGAGAFQNMAAIYGTRMADHLSTLRETLADDVLARADAAWQARGKLAGVEHDEWLASEAVKIAWRDRHPETVAYWRDVEYAARSAIMRPEQDFSARRLTFRRAGHWLLMALPSRRLLVYPWPRLRNVRRGSVYGGDKCKHCQGQGCSRCDGAGYTSVREVIQVRRFHHNGNGYWETTTAGRLVENATQAIARDVLTHGLARAEEAGLRPVLTVHDEIVCERGGEPELSAILATPPDWCSGMPLAAEGYEAQRYRKG